MTVISLANAPATHLTSVSSSFPPPTARDAPTGPQPHAPLDRSLVRHAFFWLFAANVVGVLLAALLLWPQLNQVLTPFTYGRWMPLHLNWVLYGWCSLPAIGALLAFFFDQHPQGKTPSARFALALWSLALVAGAVSWLAGVTSGKLFIDWHGWARALLPLAMIALWLVLAAQTIIRWRKNPPAHRAFKVALLTGLAWVPMIFYWATGQDVYPSVNPDSGGATGASLLGSTLGIVAIAGLLPPLLGVTRNPQAASRKSHYWTALMLSAAIYAIIGHGNVSHHAPSQILGLSTLLVWPPLAWRHFSRLAWSPRAQPWLVAAFGWWLLLVVTGFFSFLPGISEQWKFTHVLVGHGHLAMAGFLTSLNMAILRQRAPGVPDRRATFWIWQIACAVHVGAMFALGLWESAHSLEIYTGAPAAYAFHLVRLMAGLTMTGVALCWWRESWR